MYLYFCLLVFVTCWVTCGATLCWECTSLNQAWCTEHFVGKDLSAYDNQQYVLNCSGGCMKMEAYTGKNRDSFYVRTCDITKGVPGRCSTASQVLGISLSTVCVCDTNKCNSADAVRPYILVTWFLLAVLHFFQHTKCVGWCS